MKTGRHQRSDRVLVFDLDDTLYLEADFARSGFQAVSAWALAELGIAGFFDKAWALFEKAPRGDLFDETLRQLGVEVDPVVVQEMVAVYRSHAPEIQLLPDARRFLARRSDYAGFAIVSDGYHDTQQRKIEALGIASICDPIIKTDKWGREFWKPHARSFLTVQEHFQLSGAAFTYIGDNPEKDFIAPKTLGWHTVRIRREGGLHARKEVRSEIDAARTITSLDQLPQALA